MNGLIYHMALHAQTEDHRRTADAARTGGQAPRRRLFRRSL
jgi:hypothetical protein